MTAHKILTDIERRYHWHALVVSLLMDQLELLPFRGGMWGEVPMRDPLPVASLRWVHVTVDHMRN
jgi:hypothetical protein